MIFNISGHIKEAYEKRLEQMRAYNIAHKEEGNARARKYKEEHLERVRANDQEACRKGGKRYEKMLAYSRTSIPGDKKKIRRKHARQYKSYKDIIAPDSQLHHNWQNDGTAGYSGIALVEANAHQHGVIDVIQILDGKITVFTEEELKSRGDNYEGHGEKVGRDME
jgi:maltooligosyltrehalose synthase